MEPGRAAGRRRDGAGGGGRGLRRGRLVGARAACRPTQSPTSSAPADEPTVPLPDPEPTGHYATYVALGDSYTAAPLVPETDVSNDCLRSDRNYPSLVAAGLEGTKLVDVSCSAADTDSMLGAQPTSKGPVPPQFDALSERTDLVTVGLGGNDLDLFGTLVGYCPRLRDSDPTGAPCRAKLARGGEDRLLDATREIGSRLRTVIAGIRERAPRARVIVVGYPRIVPTRGTCPDLLPLATGDYRWGSRINAALARAEQHAARRAGVDYLDLYAASVGHDICSDDPWINGQVTDAARALAYHPLAAEQRAVADLVLDRL